MITLNLAPPDKKKELRLALLHVMIKNLIILVLFITVVSAIILLAAKATLQNQFNEIVDQTTLTTRNSNVFDREIKSFNNLIDDIRKIQVEHIPWTVFFAELSSLIPANVVLHSLIMNGDNIEMSGFAGTRQDLLNFQSNIENSSFFVSINVPLENLLQRIDITFNIKGKINPNQIRNAS